MQRLYGATLSRRRFLQGTGGLAVGFAVVGTGAMADLHGAGTNSPDPTKWTSWFEIRPDNTITMFTGKVDFGQSTTFCAYRQLAAAELHTTFEAITNVVAGDTDRTPDGGITAGILRGGTPNIRKAAAFTYQALLEVAAVKLGVSKDQLSVKDGIVSGGGKSISYGQLVSGQQLKLTIPVLGTLTHQGGLDVMGDPPMKPLHEYELIGKSYKNPLTTDKVTAKTIWATDVRLPGMLHGRIVHPKTAPVASGGTEKVAKPSVAKTLVATYELPYSCSIRAPLRIGTGARIQF